MEQSPALHKVPETLLKKRKRIDEIRARTVAGQIRSKKSNVHGVSRIQFRRAEKFVKEYRVKERYEIDIKRRAKKPASCKPVLPVEPKLIFVVRIQSSKTLHHQPHEVLKLLRLTKINTGTFLQLNRTTLELLQLAEPYITWGYPSTQNVRDLLYKRGHARIDEKQVALTDNALVERALGQFGIVCMEDLIHEIVTVGPHFKEVVTLLWHFRLNPPAGGWKKSTATFKKGGDCGCRSEKLHSLLKRMI